MKYFFLLWLLMSIVSCNLKTPNDRALSDKLEKGYFKIYVDKSAGDLFDDANTFLPLPFNIGSLKENNKKGIIISKRLKKGKTIVVKAIGRIEFKSDTLNNLWVCIPLDDNLKSIRSENFEEFVTLDFQAKQFIESYFRAYKGIKNDDFNKWLPSN